MNFSRLLQLEAVGILLGGPSLCRCNEPHHQMALFIGNVFYEALSNSLIKLASVNAIQLLFLDDNQNN